MSPEEQVKFCNILRYFRRGDYSLFKRACDLALVNKSNDSFFYANQFLAAQISGLIEVSAIESSTRWWISFDKSYLIESELPKIVGTDIVFFEEKDKYRPLVRDESGNSLLLGSDAADLGLNAFFGKSFVSKLPTIHFIEEEALVEEPNFFSNDANFEMFDINELSWKSKEQFDQSNKGLIRIRKRFGGVEYFLIYEELNLAFRVLHSEWAYLLAMNLFNWKLNQFINVDGSKIIIPRQLRVPNLVYKLLFANSMSCSIGRNVKFIDVHPQISDWVVNSFFEGGFGGN